MMISKCAHNGRMPFQYYACADCHFKHISCLAIYSFLYPLNICSFIMWLMYKICRCILMLSHIEINLFPAITNYVLYMVKKFVMEDTAFRHAMQILTVKNQIWELVGFLFPQQELPKFFKAVIICLFIVFFVVFLTYYISELQCIIYFSFIAILILMYQNPCNYHSKYLYMVVDWGWQCWSI